MHLSPYPFLTVLSIPTCYMTQSGTNVLMSLLIMLFWLKSLGLDNNMAMNIDVFLIFLNIIYFNLCICLIILDYHIV